MAIIVDPDSLDRDEVIFNTAVQKISMRPLGSSRHTERTDGVTTSTTRQFTSAAADFDGADSVAAGDILVVKSKDDAGHYIIESVTDANTLVVSEFTIDETNTFTDWVTEESEHVYQIFQDGSNSSEGTSGGGDGVIVDGVTEQTVYSFGKEEWRTDSVTVDQDDLIRHEFPLEAITREQMEVGGGTAHADWSWFNRYTKKKVRTGS